MATSTLGNGTLVLAGTTSGTTTVTATAVAGTTTLTLPAATDTLIGRATTDTLTNKTLTGAAMNGTVGATTPSTGAFTTLSTSGAFTTTGGSNVQTSWTLAEAGTRSLVLKNPTSSSNASVGTGTNHDLQVEGNIVYINTGSFGSRSIAATFDASGGFKTLNTIGVGNATPSTSGAGITFPATQSASSNANTLDDYEEGTWTATITNVVGTYTLTTVNYAQYTKIGQMVYGFLSVTVTTSGTASDSMNFTLPFVPAREGSGTGRENVSSGDILISRIVTGGAGEGRLYKTSGAAAGAGTGTYVVSFMFLT
jgi:hypothetical protein